MLKRVRMTCYVFNLRVYPETTFVFFAKVNG